MSSDEALAVLASAGDVAAQSELYLRWFPKLVIFIARLGSVSREDAQDIATETLYRVCVHAHWDQAGQSFAAFVYQAARNAFLDHIRSRNTDPIGFGSTTLPLNDAPLQTRSRPDTRTAPEVSDAEVGRWGHFEIARAVQFLDENGRMILNLRHQERLDWDGMGRKLGLLTGGDAEKKHRWAVNALRSKLRLRGFDLRVSEYELSVRARHLPGFRHSNSGSWTDPMDWATSLVEDVPEVVQRCLKKLEAVQADVLIMRAQEDLEWDAIAGALPDIDALSAKKIHREARKRLAELLSEEGYLLAPDSPDGFEVVSIAQIQANYASNLLIVGFRNLTYLEQTILFLLEYQNVGVVDCAKILGISTGNVSKKHAKALAALRNFLICQNCHNVPLNCVLPSAATVLEEFPEERLVRCAVAEQGPRFQAYLQVLLPWGYNLIQTDRLTTGVHILIFYRDMVLLAPHRNVHVQGDTCEDELSKIQREHELDIVPERAPDAKGIVERYQNFVLRDKQFLAAAGGVQ